VAVKEGERERERERGTAIDREREGGKIAFVCGFATF